jgi:hypothetical protein
MVTAYTNLHHAGHAHSVETWIDGELAGGLYCVALGGAVFGESMFTRRPDASKIALAALVSLCRALRRADDRLPAEHRPPGEPRGTRNGAQTTSSPRGCGATTSRGPSGISSPYTGPKSFPRDLLLPM